MRNSLRALTAPWEAGALRRVVPAGTDVRLFRSFDPEAPEGAEVPDPYYGGRDGFEIVLAQVKAASEGLAKYLADRLD